MDLEKIENPEFIKKLNKKELNELCSDIRKFLIENISNTGGHLASNLGIVEITVALYYVFDYKEDKILFDVGHQSYVHKILTGRAKEFKTLRKFNGLSGFTCLSESKYDCWESGHSSNSISAQTGFLLAKKNGENIGNVISVIGDCSIANGEAFEALNFLGARKDLAPIIIINDNKMGISKSVGGMTKVFSKLRGTKFWRNLKKFLIKINPQFILNGFHQIKRGIKGFIQRDNIFEDLGFDYYGPTDGHDVMSLIRMFNRVKKTNTGSVIHLITKKGYGYKPAEEDDYGSYHGVPPFDIATGTPKVKKPQGYMSYGEIMTYFLCKTREKEQFIVVTPAMIVGSGLKEFYKNYPNDLIDVGIAEEHAASMSAGLALNNQRVVLMMYSTFSQRAYDQILNDICRLNLSILILIDRAGVVGEDGATHQGIYDVAMFNSMPNLTLTMPKDAHEMNLLFNYSRKHTGPMVIRYSKAGEVYDKASFTDEAIDFSWEIMHEGSKGIVISYGPDLIRTLKIIEDNNFDVMLINARFINPMDTDMLHKIMKDNLPALVIEQCVNNATLATNILDFCSKFTYKPSKYIKMGFDRNTNISHGPINDVFKAYGFSDDDIKNNIALLLR